MTQVEVLAIAWFRRGDWERLLQVFSDRDVLHDTYDEWLADAEKTELQMRLTGYAVERVYIDPETFARWCAKRGVEPDGGARSTFASKALARRHRARR